MGTEPTCAAPLPSNLLARLPVGKTQLDARQESGDVLPGSGFLGGMKQSREQVQWDRVYVTSMHVMTPTCGAQVCTHTQTQTVHTCSFVHLTALCTEAQTATDPPSQRARLKAIPWAWPGLGLRGSPPPLSLPLPSPPSFPTPHSKPRASSLLSSLLLLAKTESQRDNGPARPAQITSSLGAFQGLACLSDS